MKNTLLLLLLTTIGFNCYGQPIKANLTDTAIIEDSITLDESRIITQEYSENTYFHTEANYTDFTGKGIIILNGFPRGGGLIKTPNYMSYGHAVFWSRIVNKTDTQLELTTHFPSDSIIILPSTKAHYKLIVPQNTMSLNKVSKFSYGLENIETIVESNFHQPSQIQRTIDSDEDCMFYVILLSHLSPTDKGISRAGLFLKGQDLFYRLTIDSFTSKLIPCGRVTLEKAIEE